MMMDLNALVIFAKVAQAASFSEAARRLKMPVSTVSRKIAELEDRLGVQLLERSTRSLRLTEIGVEVLDQAWRIVEARETIEGVVSNQRADVTGLLRLAAPPSISDSLLSPIVSAFQLAHAAVRIEIMITERFVDHIGDRIDLTFQVGAVLDPAMVVEKILQFRHLLVASPDYLAHVDPPQHPRDLLSHPILAFSHFRPEYEWSFKQANGNGAETVTFQPRLGINDFAGVTAGLIAGGGIGDISPIVQPEHLRSGRLVEIMPDWHFPVFDLNLIHPFSRNLSRSVRVFKDFVSKMAPSIFPDLPD